MKRISKDDRGGALLITLLVMMMLTVLAIMAVNTADTDIQLSYNVVNSDKAFYIAEAGLHRAILELNNDNGWRLGFLGVGFEHGQYTVAVIDSSTTGGLGDTVVVRSTGVVEGGAANVEAWVVPVYRKPFEYGLFGDSKVTMDNNTCTDSYNSDSGSYAGTREDLGGDVGSNGTVALDNIADIGGDVSSATEGGITISHTAEVHGDTASNVSPQVLDAIPAAEMAWAESVSNAPAGFSGSGYSYNAATKALEVTNHNDVILASGVYYFSSIRLQNHSQLKVAPGATVQIYMTDSLVMEEATQLNPTESPASLQIFSTGGMYSMENDTEIWAAFYGPQADVVLMNSVEIYGSLVAGSISMINIACLHYDRSLKDINYGLTGEMEMVAWRQY